MKGGLCATSSASCRLNKYKGVSRNLGFWLALTLKPYNMHIMLKLTVGECLNRHYVSGIFWMDLIKFKMSIYMYNYFVQRIYKSDVEEYYTT